MKGLIDSAFSHSRTVLASLALILIAGVVAYVDIAKEADPDVNIPIIYVQVTHEGISPEDAERLLIKPLEQELRTVEGVKEMRSTGYEGGAYVVMEFDAGFDAKQALQDVREQVDIAKPDLPSESEEPAVREVNFSLFPVVLVTLSGNIPERTLLRLARDLETDIEGISSVLKVEIAGDREELLEVLIDPVKVESYGLTPDDAKSIVRRSNLLIAAGAQDTGKGRFALKVPGLLETIYDMAKVPVKAQGDSVIMFKDVAEVRRTYKDRVSFARVHGKNALVLEVSKRTGENIIQTIDHVKETVASAQARWPEALSSQIDVTFSQNKSKQIKTMLNDLQNNVISAVLLVMIVIIAALGWRSAALVGIAIPGSFLTAILVLFASGFTINIVVLFALILAVGMLVDGAIVVTEYADRKMAEGDPRGKAYATAAKRMAWPIIASTATTLAAFLPLVFWPGVVGEFMKYLPLTLLATLSASLMMALIFVPTLGAYIGKPGEAATADTMQHLAGSDHADVKAIGGYTGAYLRILEKALHHPGKVLAVAVALLVGVQIFYGAFGKGVEFFPDVEPDFAKLQIRAQGNLSAEEKDKLVFDVEKRILDMNEFKTIYTRTGQSDQNEEAEDIIGTISLEFVDWRDRRKASEILAEVDRRTSDLAGIIVDRRQEEKGPPVGKPINIELSSHTPSLLPDATATVLAKVKSMDGLINIEDSRPMPGIDWVMTVDRAQAAKFQADIDSVGSAIQMASTGIKLGGYRPDDSNDEIDIRVRYPEEYRTIEQLDNIRIVTSKGEVPIANFVKRTAEPRVGEIHRTDSRRVMAVKADVAPGVLADDKVQELTQWIASEAHLDPRVKVKFKGEDIEQKKAEAFLGKAFLVALFIMAIILVTQFNSFYSAFLILSAVIMSTIGVFIGLLVTGQPFGIIMGGIGIIALAGIVVNNNIVLIDTYDRLAEDPHRSAMDAIMRTGAQRLRPVMLTSITTVLGLLPMVLGVNIDFISREVSIGAPAMQWWGQLATAIVFGLTFATILTLIVTPCALLVKANVSDWLRARKMKKAAI